MTVFEAYSPKTNIALIELVENLSINNLENVQSNINILNDDNTIDMPLNDAINIDGLINKYPNKSMEYLLTHLNKLANQERLLWNYHVRLLGEDYDIKQIEQFAEQALKTQVGPLPQYKINSLLRLSIVSNNFPLMRKIKQHIKEDEVYNNE